MCALAHWCVLGSKALRVVKGVLGEKEVLETLRGPEVRGGDYAADG